MKGFNFKEFLLDLFFPKFCFGCKTEGTYLCEDCKAILDINNFHKICKKKWLDDLYFALDYKSFLIKNLIYNFKYNSFARDLSFPISSLIIDHFKLLDKKPNFSDFILIPMPLEKTRLKWRGFNQAQKIAEQISLFLKVPLVNNVLFKKRKTPPQINLSEIQRKKNIKDAFYCYNSEKLLKRKGVLLVDDVYTTGATMEEAAKTLKKAGAKKVIGIVIARSTLFQDKLKR